MKFRRHHNNKGRRGILNGKTRKFIEYLNRKYKTKNMNIQPKGDRVLVRMSKEESKSGIILTTQKNKGGQGEVKAIGDGEEVIKLGLTIGDTVLFSNFVGEQIDEELRIIDSKDLIGIIK